MNNYELIRGYVLACCELVTQHDLPEVAADLLIEMGITQDQLVAMGLDEIDLEAMEKIRKARKVDPIEVSP